MPSKQETFDLVAAHLLVQNAKSEDSYACLYRGPNGRKCAVGVLIPDSDYDPALEGLLANDLKLTPILNKLGIDPELAADLQDVHDSHDPEEWRRKLLDLAAEHGLDDSVVNCALAERGA